MSSGAIDDQQERGLALPPDARCPDCFYSLAGIAPTSTPNDTRSEPPVSCPECGTLTPIASTKPSRSPAKPLWSCGLRSGAYLLAWSGGGWLLSWAGDGFWCIPVMILAFVLSPHPAIWMIKDVAARTKSVDPGSRLRTAALSILITVAWITPSIAVYWLLLRRALVIVLSAT